MAEVRAIRLTVPGRLVYRDVAVRAVMEACSLVGQDEDAPIRNGREGLDDRIVLTRDFDVSVVTAFGEIFNNIAIHAYGGDRDGDIEILLSPAADHISISVRDEGGTFDISSVPEPGELPEGGMGIHLAKIMLDELVYEPGPPNRWTLVKYKTALSPRPAADHDDGRDHVS